ncbi:MAG: hypothetical protein V1799_13740 [bacterium]
MIALPERDNIQDYYNSVSTALGSSPIDLIIFGYRFSRFTDGHRWVYHPEYNQHYPGFTGRRGQGSLEGAGSADADLDQTQVNINAWRVLSGSGGDSSGYIANGLLMNSEQPDSVRYFIKVRMRLVLDTPFDNKPALVVKAVRADTTMVDTIFANEFSNYNYREVPSLVFRKMPVGQTAQPQQSINEIRVSHVPPRDTIGYATGHPDEVISTASNTAFDYQLYWPGQVSCFVDYIAIDDSVSNRLFLGTNDTAISGEVIRFRDSTKLIKFKINDEPASPHWPLVGYVDNIIRSNLTAGNLTKRGFHYNIGYDNPDPDRMVKRNIRITGTMQNMADIYPFKADLSKTPWPSSNNYTSEIQWWVQTYLIDKLAINIKHSKANDRDFWYQAQAHSWENFENGIWNGDQREPTVGEIRLQVNLALAYGAKGIQYFLYRSYDSQADRIRGIGLTNVDGSKREIIHQGTSYAGNKWETVKAINQKLSSLGPTLVNLTWLGAKSWHNETVYGSWGSLITSIHTEYPTETKYIETAHFQYNNTNYFYVVNRRTKPDESRTIKLTFNNTVPWNIIDIAPGISTRIRSNDTFSI